MAPIWLTRRLLRRAPTTLEATAYHEAGHAVARIALHRSIRSVSIVATEDSLGHVRKRGHSEEFMLAGGMRSGDRSLIERDVISMFAGPAAEALATGRWNNAGARQDFQQATRMIQLIVQSDDEVEPYLRFLQVRARNMMQTHWNWLAIRALARALLREKSMTGARAKAVVKAACDADEDRALSKIPLTIVTRDGPAPADDPDTNWV